jgi:hypothetical protein
MHDSARASAHLIMELAVPPRAAAAASTLRRFAPRYACHPTRRRMACAEWRWPDPQSPQQMHIDVRVEDIDAAEARPLELGARRLEGGGDQFRVYADPAGHPFCLVWW